MLVIKNIVENRKEKRHPISAQINFDPSIIDICKGGIGVISNKKLPVGQKLVLEILSKRGSDPVLVSANIKWSRAFKDEGETKYRIGLSFEDDLNEGSKKFEKMLSVLQKNSGK